MDTACSLFIFFFFLVAFKHMLYGVSCFTQNIYGNFASFLLNTVMLVYTLSLDSIRIHIYIIDNLITESQVETAVSQDFDENLNLMVIFNFLNYHSFNLILILIQKEMCTDLLQNV